MLHWRQTRLIEDTSEQIRNRQASFKTYWRSTSPVRKKSETHGKDIYHWRQILKFKIHLFHINFLFVLGWILLTVNTVRPNWTWKNEIYGNVIFSFQIANLPLIIFLFVFPLLKKAPLLYRMITKCLEYTYTLA